MAYASISAEAIRLDGPALEFTTVRTNLTFIYNGLELGEDKGRGEESGQVTSGQLSLPVHQGIASIK